MSLQAAIAGAITHVGESVTLRRYTTPGTIGADGKLSGEAYSDLSLTAAFRSIDRRLVDGEFIQHDDVLAKITVDDLSGATPAAGDQLTRGADILKVLNVREKRVAGTVVAYELHARGA